MSKEPTPTEIITIGSDPEFCLVSPTGKTIGLNNVISSDGEDLHKTEFGFDGHSATGELRPLPKKSPKEAVHEIKRILEVSKKKYPNAYKYNLHAVSNQLSLGGHIHFGHNLIRSADSETRQTNEGYIGYNCGNDHNKRIERLVKNLDTLLAIPCLFLEDRQDAKYRRNQHSYGKLSDFRTQQWGFEYRVLPSFMSSREATSSIFHLAYAIADDTLFHNLEVKPIVKKDKNSLDYIFNGCATEILKPHLDTIFVQIKDLHLYKKELAYKREINRFIKLVEKEEKVFTVEIKEGWKINFDISDFWKLDRIETLIDKIAKLLVTIHTHPDRYSKNKPKVLLASGSPKDVGCIEIANTCNIAMNELTDEVVLTSLENIGKLQIYGLKGSRGNCVHIGNNSRLNYKERKTLLGMLWGVASEIRHQTKVEGIQFNPDHNTRYNAIAFGRKMREENIILAEAMTIITLLIMYRELYKTADKGKALRTTKAKVVKPMVNAIKDNLELSTYIPLNKHEHISGIILPSIIDLRLSVQSLDEKIRTLEHNEKTELGNAIVESNIIVKLEKITQETPTTPCDSNGCYGDSPLKDRCKKHLAEQIIRTITRNMQPPYSGWGVVRECECCEQERGKYNQDTWCQENCDKCLECCTCNDCEICEQNYDNCECYNCESCEQTVSCDSGDFCHNCNCCTTCCNNRTDDPCRNCEQCGETTFDRRFICSNCEVCENCCNGCESEEQDEPEPDPDTERTAE